MHTTNYVNTLIEIAEDSPVTRSEVPPRKETEETIAYLQYAMIRNHPYAYTSDDVIFGVYARRNGIGAEEYEEKRAEFFSKGQACLRCSPLPKRYGWGVHSDQDGKVAIYAVESEEYRKLLLDGGVKRTQAMRSKRK